MFISNEIISDINNLVSSAEFVDGNISNRIFIKDVQEFADKYRNENIPLKIIYGAITSNLSARKISLLAKCLPVLVSLGEISELESRDIYQCLECLLTF